MAQIKIAGIMRAGAYSPNHIGSDAAIFNVVADQLRKRGCEVNIYTEEQLISGAVSEHVILNMCRDPRSIAELQHREDLGDLVINSAYGIENCTRERMARILPGSGIPYPPSLIVNTDEVVRGALDRAGIDRCWLKRGDGFGKHKEDVTCVRHIEEAQEVLQEFFLRGIKCAVINRHMEGELIKFYGVRGTDFFYWFHPFEASRFQYSPEAQADLEGLKAPLDEARLRRYCLEAAEVMDVIIYGGDCIVAADGTITLIDFNDWPSFAPCRQEAAPYIAREVLARAKRHLKQRP